MQSTNRYFKLKPSSSRGEGGFLVAAGTKKTAASEEEEKGNLLARSLARALRHSRTLTLLYYSPSAASAASAAVLRASISLSMK